MAAVEATAPVTQLKLKIESPAVELAAEGAMSMRKVQRKDKAFRRRANCQQWAVTVSYSSGGLV